MSEFSSLIDAIGGANINYLRSVNSFEIRNDDDAIHLFFCIALYCNQNISQFVVNMIMDDIIVIYYPLSSIEIVMFSIIKNGDLEVLKNLEKLFFRKYHFDLFRNCVQYAVHGNNIEIIKYFHGLRPITKQEYPDLSRDLVTFGKFDICNYLDQIGYGLIDLPEYLIIQDKHYKVLKIILCHPELSKEYAAKICRWVKEQQNVPNAPKDFIRLLAEKANILLYKKK